MNLQSNACDFCRRRKLKCSRQVPNCDKCIRYKQSCTYSAKNKRISLTKTNFLALQNRVEILEKVLKKLVPNEAQINSLVNEVTNNDELYEPSIAESDFEDQGDELIDNEIVEDHINDIDDLVWYETDDEFHVEDINKNLIDGMSALSIQYSNDLKIPMYYGISSPNGLLKYLQNSKKILLENYKPVALTPDYKNLDVLRQQYGENFLDNTQFHETLLDTYFNTFHKAYPIISKNLFYQEYYNLPKKTSLIQIKSIKILIYTLLSMGSFFKFGDNSIVDLLYYKRIKQELRDIDLMEYNSFHLLEALTLLGNYCQKRNKPNTGWNYHGICFKMAISFGLHREINIDKSKANQKSIEILERRRRLFWGLYLLDVGHSITLGRPSVSPSLESINIEFPSVDYDLDPNSNVSNPSLMVGFVEELKLIKISTKINNTLNNVTQSNSAKRILTLLEYSKEIDNLCDELPLDFKDSSESEFPSWFLFRRKKVIWRCRNMQILMFRNYIWTKPPSNSNSPKSYTKEVKLINECIEICTKISLEAIESINDFIKTHEMNVFQSWYGIYFVVHAVLVPILLIYNHKSDYSPEQLQQFHYYINLSKQTLNMLSPLNRLTNNLINLIDILSKSVNSEDVSMNEMFNNDLGDFMGFSEFNDKQFKDDGELNDTVFDLSPINFNVFNV